MAWTMLESGADWEEHQKRITLGAGLGTGAPIAWGKGPQTYPCLVCTCVVAGTQSKILSAYVYPDDAMMLCEETGMLKKEVVNATTEQQDGFNHWVTAYLLALTRELREVGALKAEPFERSLMESLSLVDEVTAEKRDAMLAQLHPQEQTLLNRLQPRVNSGD
jgi:hypothetical protein